MIKRLLVLLLLPAFGVAMPAHSPWPGGVAVVPVGQFDTRPAVRFQGSPVLTLPGDDGWVAIIGIPLDQAVGTAHVSVNCNDAAVSFDTVEKRYREQHLSVKPSYVNPNPDALERIGRERTQIANAIALYSDIAPSATTLQPPVPGNRSDSFGSRRFFNGEPRSPHRGMDLSGKRGTPVAAVLDGTVVLSGNFYFTGNAVFVDHGAGLISLYAHLDSIDIETGDRVKTGEILGTVGSTGRVTGPHLHFATYLNNTPVDPALLLTDAQ